MIQKRSVLWKMIRLLPWAFLVLVIILPLVFVFKEAGNLPAHGDTLDRLPGVLYFTFIESLVSSLLALLLGMGGAWVLGTISFRGSSILSAISNIPFVFPTILFILGFQGIFGTSGLYGKFHQALTGEAFLGGYGFMGIVWAHALFNFPLFIGIIGSAWRRLPREYEDAAKMLGAKPLYIFRTLTIKALFPSIASAFLLVFLFCFMSFVIPLTLGGGPEYETIEVFVKNSFFSELNPALSSIAGLSELFISLAMMIGYFFLRQDYNASYEIRPKISIKSIKLPLRVLIRIIIIITLILGILPFIGLVAASLQYKTGVGSQTSFGLALYAKVLTNPETYIILLRGILIAIVIAFSSILMSWLIASMLKVKNKLQRLIFSLPLGVSPVLLSLGWNLSDLGTASLIALIFAQIAMTYPLAYRTLLQARDQIPTNMVHSAQLLGARGLFYFLSFELPLLRPILLSSLIFCMSISLGDVNIPLMLNFSEIPLPAMYVSSLMSSRNFGTGAVFGVVFLLVVAILYIFSKRLGDEYVV